MAKIGEGDPRWIVEERSDAANVNNWHWIERDVLNWSKDKLNTLLVNKSMDNSKYKCVITAVSTDGISTVSIRKGRVKQIFDLELQVKFKAQLKSSKKEDGFEGNISVSEFTWETNENNVEFEVSFISSKRDNGLMEFIKNAFKPLLLDVVTKYREALNAGLVLPTKNTPVTFNNVSNQPTNNIKVGIPVSAHPIPPYDSGVLESQSNEHATEKDAANVDPSTFAVNISKTFNCSSCELYNMFLSPEKMMVVTNAPAYIEPKIGGKFSYIDGTVSGNFVTLDENKYIEMNWRLRNWPDIYYSTAKLKFTNEKNNTCKLSIKHDKIPAHDLERVDHGWKRMFLDPMQAIFA